MNAITRKYKSWPKIEIEELALKLMILGYFAACLTSLFINLVHWQLAGFLCGLVFVAVLVTGWALIIKDNWRSPRLWLYVGGIVALALVASLLIASGS